MILTEELWSWSNSSVVLALVNISITAKWNMVTVQCAWVSFVLLVIHLGAALPLQLLFLKAVVAFTSSTDRES